MIPGKAGEALSLKPKNQYTVPGETERVARAIFPDGNLYMKIYDTFGTLFEEQDFVGLFAKDGQPALSPVRLALVLIVEFIEKLSDRQVADAVRTRIDLKYLLCLDLTDQGFHHSVLTEFRDRLLPGHAERVIFEKLLAHFREQGLLKVRGRQRTDSTHVLAAVRGLNRLMLVHETMRQALNTLAVSAPNWTRENTAAEWVERYASRAEEMRLPQSKGKRIEMAERIGVDGLQLLCAIFNACEHAWLRKLPVIKMLWRVWIQNYTWGEDSHLRWRTNLELPPSEQFINTPYDEEAHYSKKRSTSWVGYKVHLSETCDHEAPRLITHVETTAATLPDSETTLEIQSELQAKELLPQTHLVDMGYVDAGILVSSQDEYHLDLVGPTKGDYHWQAQAGEGFAAENFVIDWQHQQATCPAGRTSLSWTPAVDNRKNEVIKIKFSRKDCAPCDFRSQCTRAKKSPRRTITIKTQREYLALREARQRQETAEFKQLYALRAGVEGTISQGVRAFGMRRSRYIGLAKTHLQHILIAAAMNIVRAIRWLSGEKLAVTRQSAFGALHAKPSVA